MKPTMVHLPQSLVDRLDGRATVRAVSRSALVREAVERLLDDGDDAEVAEAYIRGYGAVPADAPDAWGHMSAFRDDLRSARAELGDVETNDAAAW